MFDLLIKQMLARVNIEELKESEIAYSMFLMEIHKKIDLCSNVYKQDKQVMYEKVSNIFTL